MRRTRRTKRKLGSPAQRLFPDRLGIREVLTVLDGGKVISARDAVDFCLDAFSHVGEDEHGVQESNNNSRGLQIIRFER